MKTCPTCGQTLPCDLPVEWDLSRLQRRILSIVQSSGQHGLSSDQLFERLYADDADGGPLTGKKSMYVIVRLLNKRLEPHGLAVCCGRGGPGSPKTYKLQQKGDAR